MKLRGPVPHSYIHVSVSDLYITTIGLPILLQENRWTNRENRIYTRIWKLGMIAALLFGKYINRIFFAVQVSQYKYRAPV